MRKRFDSYKQASKALRNGSESLSSIASAILNDSIILPHPLWDYAARLIEKQDGTITIPAASIIE